MFREVANVLRDAGCYHEAIRYYQPLEQVFDFVNASDYAGMAFCYKSLGLGFDAETCYQNMADLEQDPSRNQNLLPPSISLVALKEEAILEIASGTVPVNQQTLTNEGINMEESGLGEIASSQVPSAMLMPRSSKQSSKHRESERRLRAQLHEERMRSLYGRAQELLELARNGDVQALAPWMAAAQELVNDFRSHRGFYPCDRSLKAYERSKSSAIESLKSRVNQAMQDIIGQLDTPAGEVLHSDQ